MSNQLSGNNNFLLSFLQMDSNPCYNCGQARHRSKICPEPQIDSNGNVSFNINAQNDVTERIVSKIQIDNNDDIFKVRISWYGHKYVFHVHPDVGPILIDPLHPQKNGPTKKENININAVIKLQDEADDVRLVGNVTSDGNLGRTFSLSFNVRDLDDSMFDLSQQFKDLFANVKREIVERADANSEAVNRSILHE